ncbi:TlpA disulfide reductase family protein [Denitrificimonas sp. JX-1]|uniref:TlpA disulfide reductase family protein n=1 Tax=Denitrificimonas halotolerans TaxID=3098930 RepID=A0ABU5GT92_9GAMM|nr:TlpA disulfide reductase family protein [Denitrificimonas sp. JX-1]MDY7219837.1 TlpA disulfide reductase family protein [Denitrificimonas sp. JX-1]
MLSFNLGPFAIPMDLALLYAAFFIAWFSGWLIGRKRGANPESVLFNMLLIGALVSRMTFVLKYFEQYADNLIQIVDIRDGGFLLLPGLIAAVLVGIYKAWRQSSLRIPLATGVCIGLVVWGASISVMNALHSSQKIPEISLRDIDGNPVALHSLAGKPLVVNLWATWCPPCRREMPVLEAAQKNNPEISFVFVNQGEGQALVDKFLTQQQLSLKNVLLDTGGRVGQSVGSLSLPTTLFYSADGLLKNNHLGELSPASLKHALRHISSAEQKIKLEEQL